MTDLTSSDRLLVRTAPSNGRPVRKDEIELTDRGLYVESWLPERRSRRKPILFVHGELGGSWVWERYLHHFAGRGWEGHALNLRNHFWSQTADPTTLDVETYTEDVVAAMERLGPTVVAVGHGLGGLLVLKAIERVPVSAYVLIAPELPREVRDPARPHVVRDVPDAYGRSELGWETLPEKLQREHRDLTLADVLRIQHLLGQKPFESGRARRQVLQGVPVDRGGAARRPAARHRRRAGLVRARARGGAPRGVARRAVRAVRRALALRPRAGRAELPPGRRDAPRRSSRRIACRDRAPEPSAGADTAGGGAIRRIGPTHRAWRYPRPARAWARRPEPDSRRSPATIATLLSVGAASRRSEWLEPGVIGTSPTPSAPRSGDGSRRASGRSTWRARSAGIVTASRRSCARRDG